MNSKLIKASLAVPAALAIAGGGVALAGPGPQPHEAHASSFDPYHSNLVASGWVTGIGCPTNATNTVYNGSTDSGDPAPPYSDAACGTGDSKDKKNEGLLLAKTGPTANDAEAAVEIKDVKGASVTELGYDLRKPGADVTDPHGSHCGAGSPMFVIVYSDNTTGFIGCNSPHPSSVTPGTGFMRLRWDASAIGSTDKTVSHLYLVNQEGQDASGGPDQFGLAVLDNIDVNGTLIGQGDHGDLG